jgi:transcriptional regulator
MEAPRQKPWQVSDAPHDFIDAQLKAIVGLEIEITSVEGKWKMSQNRTAQDAKGVALGLADPGDPHHNPEVAAIVASRSLIDD